MGGTATTAHTGLRVGPAASCGRYSPASGHSQLKIVGKMRRKSVKENSRLSFDSRESTCGGAPSGARTAPPGRPPGSRGLPPPPAGAAAGRPSVQGLVAPHQGVHLHHLLHSPNRRRSCRLGWAGARRVVARELEVAPQRVGVHGGGPGVVVPAEEAAGGAGRGSKRSRASRASTGPGCLRASVFFAWQCSRGGVDGVNEDVCSREGGGQACSQPPGRCRPPVRRAEARSARSACTHPTSACNSTC